MFINFAKMLVAGFLTFAAGYFICQMSDNYFEYTLMYKTVKIIVIMILSLFLYTGLNILFKMDYAKELLLRLSKK